MNSISLSRLAVILAVSTTIIPNVPAQQASGLRGAPEAPQIAPVQEKLQEVINNKAGYAAAIVQRWEGDASASGKWDQNSAVDLQTALMKLQPENLLAAGEAPSYNTMLRVLRTGRRPFRASLSLSDPSVSNPKPQGISTDTIGDFADDLVYTPVTPCRIVDTRIAGGAILANTTRGFDVDNPTSFAFQGGYNGACGIPYDVVSAVAMTITGTGSTAQGYFTAWAVNTSQPLASVLNFVAGETIANTTIVPVDPGAGNDFYIYSPATTQVVVDVVGYFATPVATALDCTQSASALTAVPVNVYTAVDATCPAGRTATGGGFLTSEGTLGYPGVWTFTLSGAAYGFNGWRTYVDNQTNGNRNIQTWATCCRVPGR